MFNEGYREPSGYVSSVAKYARTGRVYNLINRITRGRLHRLVKDAYEAIKTAEQLVKERNPDPYVMQSITRARMRVEQLTRI